MLFPLYAHERSPHGLWKLAASTSVEGGMVGKLVDEGGSTHVGEVVLYDGTEDLYGPDPLVGLIDDSTAAVHGRGVTGVGVALAPGVTPETGTPTGPATHLASGKCTLWMDPGTFVTDTWDKTDIPDLSALAVGHPLGVVKAGGLLAKDADGVILARFVRRLVGGSADSFDSYFLPRVQPLPAGRVFMVLRFKS